MTFFKRTLLVLPLLLMSLFAYANPDKVNILAIMKAQENAWNQGLLEQYMAGYWQSEELQFVGKNGIKYGWQATLDNYQRSYPSKAAMGQLKFEILSIETTDQTAFVLGKWTLKKANEAVSGFYTLLWKKIEGDWKIVIDHSS